MFRDITIGQYYAVDSPVHKLDPRVKLMGTLLYCVLLFLVKNPIWYLPLALGQNCVALFINAIQRKKNEKDE